jgi:hypothetical protein
MLHSTPRHQQTQLDLAVLPILNKNIILNAYFILVLYFNFLFSFIIILHSTTSAIADQ